MCCDILRINGVVCHETGCFNQGTIPVKQTRRQYVGIVAGTRDRVAFSSTLPVTPHYYPEYAAVIGPFKTKRAAVWAAHNPCNWSHVSDAETLSKGGR